MRFAAAVAAFVALPALPGHTVEESKSETIGPWEIEAVFDGDKFDRCAIHRPVRDGIVVRFARTADGLSLELESPNWKLERGKNYPVKMAMGPLSFDAEVAAEPNSVSMAIKDEKVESALRRASALNVVAAGATIRVPRGLRSSARTLLVPPIRSQAGGERFPPAGGDSSWQKRSHTSVGNPATT